MVSYDKDTSRDGVEQDPDSIDFKRPVFENVNLVFLIRGKRGKTPKDMPKDIWKNYHRLQAYYMRDRSRDRPHVKAQPQYELYPEMPRGSHFNAIAFTGQECIAFTDDGCSEKMRVDDYLRLVRCWVIEAIKDRCKELGNEQSKIVGQGKGSRSELWKNFVLKFKGLCKEHDHHLKDLDDLLFGMDHNDGGALPEFTAYVGLLRDRVRQLARSRKEPSGTGLREMLKLPTFSFCATLDRWVEFWADAPGFTPPSRNTDALKRVQAVRRHLERYRGGSVVESGLLLWKITEEDHKVTDEEREILEALDRDMRLLVDKQYEGWTLEKDLIAHMRKTYIGMELVFDTLLVAEMKATLERLSREMPSVYHTELMRFHELILHLQALLDHKEWWSSIYDDLKDGLDACKKRLQEIADLVPDLCTSKIEQRLQNPHKPCDNGQVNSEKWWIGDDCVDYFLEHYWELSKEARELDKEARELDRDKAHKTVQQWNEAIVMKFEKKREQCRKRQFEGVEVARMYPLIVYARGMVTITLQDNDLFDYLYDFLFADGVRMNRIMSYARPDTMSLPIGNGEEGTTRDELLPLEKNFDEFAKMLERTAVRPMYVYSDIPMVSASEIVTTMALDRTAIYKKEPLS